MGRTGHYGNMGYWGCYYEPFGPCMTKTRVVFAFTAQSQTRSQLVLDSAKVALLLVSNPVCNIHRQDLKVQPG